MTSRSPNDSNNMNNNSSSSGVASVLAGNKDSVNEIGALQKTFQEAIKSPHDLDEAVNYLYQSLLEDAVVNVFLEVHNLNKTGNLTALDGIADEGPETSMPNYDIFGLSTAEKPVNFSCPNCDKVVSAGRFAPHLETCMGMGRTPARKPSRRLASKEGLTSGSLSSSYLHTNTGTDNKDDVDLSSKKRRKKIATNYRNNGSKKNNGKSF